MNREIKFRAWDGSSMFNSHNNIENSDVMQLTWFFNKLREYAPIMQFTGLKDKNGVEIYEGDIDNKGRVCEYFHNLGSFGFKNPKYAPITFIGQFTDRGNYVVGNIYENPELLTI